MLGLCAEAADSLLKSKEYPRLVVDASRVLKTITTIHDDQHHMATHPSIYLITPIIHSSPWVTTIAGYTLLLGRQLAKGEADPYVKVDKISRVIWDKKQSAFSSKQMGLSMPTELSDLLQSSWWAPFLLKNLTLGPCLLSAGVLSCAVWEYCTV